MLHTERDELVNVHGREEGELYDFDADPDERENRWYDPDYFEVKVTLLTRLSDRHAQTADSLPPGRGIY